MRIYASNPIVTDNPSTNLSASTLGAVTSLPVYSSAGFPSATLALLGLYGDEQSEVVKTSATGSNTFTLTAGTIYPHVQDTQVTYMPYDQIELSRSDDGGATWVVVSTTNIQTDRATSVLIDNAGIANSLWRYRFYNTITTIFSNYSTSLSQSGYAPYQLEKMQDREVGLFNDPNLSFLQYSDITDWFNEFSDQLAEEVYMSDKKALTSLVTITGSPTVPITLPDNFVKLIYLRVSYDGTHFYKATPTDITSDEFSGLESDISSSFDIESPLYMRQDNQIVIYPNGQNGGTNSIVAYKLYYYRLPTYLVNPGDALDLIFRPFTHMYIDYGFVRAKMKDSKLNDMKAVNDYLKEARGMFIESMSRWQVDRPETESDDVFDDTGLRRVGRLT